MEGAHVIDIDQLINSSVTKENGCEIDDCKTRRPLIRRIDMHIRNKHKTVYEPIMLVIGPYNHRIPGADGMKLTKHEFLNYVLSLNSEKSLADYIEVIKGMEEQVRKFYADDIRMDRNEFRKMLLLDGCFMLVYLRGTKCSIEEMEESNNISNSGIDEVTLGTDGTNMACEDDHEDAYFIDELHSHDFWRDVLLLENQIPFFVITKINELVAGGSNTTSVFVDKVVGSVENALCCYPNASFKHNRPKEFYHLLQLCHMYFRPCMGEAQNCESQVKLPLLNNVLHSGSNLLRKHTKSEAQQAGPKSNPWHRATEYNQARIGFRKREYSSVNPNSLLDIVFCNGIIEIPGLTIDPTTQTLFCNLIAFEQSCPQFGSYVTAYIVFLSSLISKPEDVSLLTEDSIIMHQLNSDGEVCDLFREIRECAAASFEEDNYLKPPYHRIEAHYQSQRSSLGQLFAAIPSKINILAQRSESDLPR